MIGPSRRGDRLLLARRSDVGQGGNAPALLFDRLASSNTEATFDAMAARWPDAAEEDDGSRAVMVRHAAEKASYVDLAHAWRASIANELSDLFQTTSRVPIRRYEGQILDLLDYGLPDTRGLSMQSSQDQQLLSRVMVLAITRFEPRLSDLHITLQAGAVGPADARVSIRARIRAGPVHEEAHFVLTQSARGLSRVVPLDPVSAALEDAAGWQGPVLGQGSTAD